MSVKAFTVGGVQYNAAMASAVDQDRVMSLLSGAIIQRFASGAEMDEKVLAPMFMSMNQEVKAQVAQILLGRCVVNGTDRPVSVADFGGRMVQYNLLLAEILKWNLSDFFDWLLAVAKDARAAASEERAQ